MARVSLGVSGTATSADDDGSGNDSDGTTPAPMPASTMPNTALLWPISCATSGCTPWRRKMRSISGRLPDAWSSSTTAVRCRSFQRTLLRSANG